MIATFSEKQALYLNKYINDLIVENNLRVDTYFITFPKQIKQDIKKIFNKSVWSPLLKITTNLITLNNYENSATKFQKELDLITTFFDNFNNEVKNILDFNTIEILEKRVIPKIASELKSLSSLIKTGRVDEKSNLVLDEESLSEIKNIIERDIYYVVQSKESVDYAAEILTILEIIKVSKTEGVYFSFNNLYILIEDLLHNYILSHGKDNQSNDYKVIVNNSKVLLNMISSKTKFHSTNESSNKQRALLKERQVKSPVTNNIVKEISFLELKSKLDEKYYGQEDLKESLVKSIAIAKYNKNGFKLSPTLLYGSPGVGKSYILKIIAENLGLPYLYLSLNGMNSWVLSGQNPSWKGAAEGKIASFLKDNNRPKNAIIILDEIDKYQRSSEGDNMSNVLSAILDENLNNEFTDQFTNEKFDLSGITFLMTSNEISTNGAGFGSKVFPSYLLNRMNVLKINDYTKEEKFCIIQNHVIKKVLNNYNYTDKEFILNEDCINFIINTADEAGLRQSEKMIELAYKDFIYYNSICNQDYEMNYSNLKNSLKEFANGTPKFKVGFC